MQLGDYNFDKGLDALQVMIRDFEGDYGEITSDELVQDINKFLTATRALAQQAIEVAYATSLLNIELARTKADTIKGTAEHFEIPVPNNFDKGKAIYVATNYEAQLQNTPTPHGDFEEEAPELPRVGPVAKKPIAKKANSYGKPTAYTPSYLKDLDGTDEPK